MPSAQLISVSQLNRQFEILVFGSLQSASDAVFFFHDESGFDKGVTGQFESEGFASQLLRSGTNPDIPFIFLCARNKFCYNKRDVAEAIRLLTQKFAISGIHIIGEREGCSVAQGLPQDHVKIRSATIIFAKEHEKLSKVNYPMLVLKRDTRKISNQPKNHLTLNLNENIVTELWPDEANSEAVFKRTQRVFQWINSRKKPSTLNTPSSSVG